MRYQHAQKTNAICQAICCKQEVIRVLDYKELVTQHQYWLWREHHIGTFEASDARGTWTRGETTLHKVLVELDQFRLVGDANSKHYLAKLKGLVLHLLLLLLWALKPSYSAVEITNLH